jgi:hypothetical protein
VTTYTVGDTVHLAITVTPRGSSVPTDTTMALTVTAPDGTITAPAINHDGTGQYSADVPTAMSGYYSWSWVGSGAVVVRDIGQVYVQGAGFRIVSLDEARDQVNKTPGFTGDDSTLRMFIEAAGSLVERLAGPVVPRTVVECHSGPAVQIFPKLWPVLSITSVVETWPAGPSYTLNQMANLAAPSTGYDFTFDPDTGAITRRVARLEYFFPTGVDNIVVTYVAGRAQPWPPTYRLAALAYIAWLGRMFMSGRGAGRPNLVQEETVAVPGYGMVPAAIVQLVGNVRPPQAGA